MKNQRNSLRGRPSIPEVVAFPQGGDSTAGKINLSIDEEVVFLRERTHQLESENAVLRERETALVRDGVETLNVVIETFRGVPEIDADLFTEYARAMLGTATNNREAAAALHDVAATAANITEIVLGGRR